MKKPQLNDDLQELLPLTPAVFYVLLSLSDGEKHGYAIMLEMKKVSSGQFRMGPATLYTTLQRLLELGLIDEVPARESPAESDNRRRYYRLRGDGQAVLDAEVSRMESVVRMAKKRKKLLPETAR